ncbi:MAG: hypothetical protein Q8Q02_05365 [Nocardioides sp.]|nr:hypothetical protein [Nocardioides sp.]
MSDPSLPREVAEVCAAFLALADEAEPGLVEGLYLHGSLGFGEWYAGRSDIDHVAVLSRPPAEAASVLEDVHRRLVADLPAPSFDGFHLTWAGLRDGPVAVGEVPCTQGGLFHPAERLDVHPVTWHELAGHGLRVRGPALADVALWSDHAALRRYTHENLTSYWAAELEQLARFPQELARGELVAWFVLGPARLHHLLVRDVLTSKDGAGAHVVSWFGERWRPVVAEALGWRGSGTLPGALEGEGLAREVLALATLVVEDGRRHGA